MATRVGAGTEVLGGVQLGLRQQGDRHVVIDGSDGCVDLSKSRGLMRRTGSKKRRGMGS
jgi:hypothetical protein